MVRPDSVQKYEEIDLKLGIKSSLPHPKSTLALLFLLWESNKCPAELVYADQEETNLVIKTDVFTNISEYLQSLNIDIGSTEHLRATINGNQLLKSQLEALIVAFELIWRVARIGFVDTNMPNSAERTGGVRYPKIIRYTANMDILHALIKSNEDSFIRVLLKWMGLECEAAKECDDALCQMLTVFSENAIYKFDNHGQAVLFNQNSIYKKCISNPDSGIDISGDSEAKGPLRILKTLISDHLNTFLANSPAGVKGTEENVAQLADYEKRVAALLELSSDKIAIRESTESEDVGGDVHSDGATSTESLVFQTNIRSVFPRNRILFGAPGTGKSFKLNADREKLLGDNTEGFGLQNIQIKLLPAMEMYDFYLTHKNMDISRLEL